MSDEIVEETPYWWEAAPRPVSELTTLPKSVDVVVVGAGFTGLCAALVLARAGASVAVFEAGVLGEGASSRNGGMVGPSFHKLGLSGLKRKFGQTRANALLQESIGFVDYLEDFLIDEKIEADFQRTGRFRGALKPAHFDAMQRDLDILKSALQIEARMVTRADQEAETGSPLFHGGVVYDRDACLHPAKYHDGLVKRVRTAGVETLAHTEVRAVDKIPDGFRVQTSRGELRAGQVAICSNGYTQKVTPDLRRRILPLRSAMIATEPLDPALMRRLMPKRRVYGDSRRLVAYYRPSPDSTRILFGGRASGLTDRPAANKRILRAAMTQVFPDLEKTPLSHVWSGLVAYTFDHLPHLGEFGGGKQDGMYYALGYCGSGVARSTYFGTKLGHKMLKDGQGGTAFDDLVMETRPLYSGNPWFMPAILAWHRAADRLGL